MATGLRSNGTNEVSHIPIYKTESIHLNNLGFLFLFLQYRHDSEYDISFIIYVYENDITNFKTICSK